MQLVKDLLRLVNGTGWAAGGSRRPGRFTPGAVVCAGGGSGLWLALALTGHHRDWRGSGAGACGGSGGLAAAWSATAATASKTKASGIFGAIRFFRARLLGYRRRLPQPCLVSWVGLPRHVQHHDQWRLAAAGQMSFHQPVHLWCAGPGRPLGLPGSADRLGALSRSATAPQPHAGGRAVRSCPGASSPPSAAGWSGMSRPAGPGPAPWPAPRRGLAGRLAGPPASGAHAGSSARRYGCA